MEEKQVSASLLTELEAAKASGDFNEIAKLEAFSAVASGAATAEDFKKLRFHLLSVGISESNCANDDQVHEAVRYITSQIMRSTDFN